MGRGQERIWRDGGDRQARSQEAEAETNRGGQAENHRRHQAAMGGGPGRGGQSSKIGAGGRRSPIYYATEQKRSHGALER